ncbi:MAG: SDR family oxidoreductase [Candidatus Solibacter usitatus]|nr:SDR family oxidoreductase [Candidatus Solibacter usitatus]
MLLEGKIALVTGGSRGIGKAIAAAFAREGATTVICGRKQETLDDVAAELDGNVIPRACHVGKPDELARWVEGVTRDFGPADILVNNAATNVAQGPCLSVDDAQFDKMIEVNLKSAFRLVRLVAPGMCARGSGSIINIASISGLKPQFEGLMYSATKAALIMMTRCYALELGPKGVRVNAIAPGLVQTVLSEYYWKDPARQAAFLGKTPIKRIAQPEEIAEVALLLAGDRCPYLTGEVITVDGGSTLV